MEVSKWCWSDSRDAFVNGHALLSQWERLGWDGVVWSDGLALDECLRWPFVRGLRCELWAAVTPVSVGAVQLNSTQFRLVDSYVFMLELHTVQCIMIVADFWFDEDRTDV